MSVVWANNLKSKTAIHAGQVLRIPPVTGLIVTVTAADTLDSIAARYNVNGTDILATNGLEDPNLVVGQVLVIPGAQGAALAAPALDHHPRVERRAAARASVGAVDLHGRQVPVAGRRWRQLHQPVLPLRPLRDRHRRRLRLDRPRCGGWHGDLRRLEEQRWRLPGLDRPRSRLYTTYNHMSAITVGAGQHVAAASRSVGSG